MEKNKKNTTQLQDSEKKRFEKRNNEKMDKLEKNTTIKK